MNLLTYAIAAYFACYSDQAYGFECPLNTSVRVDDLCVLWNNQLVTWLDAKKTCANMGMHVATVRSTDQMARIKQALPSSIKLDIWTGANDIEREGHFVWEEDNSPVVEKIWKKGEPNNQNLVHGEEDCTFINPELMLYDIWCTARRNSLCIYRIPGPVNVFSDNNVSFVCHCHDFNCSSDGSCAGDSAECAKGWFNPGCQIRSLSGDENGPLGLLADNNDSSCDNITVPVSIKLKDKSFFTYIRIIVEKPEYLGGFAIYFNVDDTKVVCQGVKLLPLDNRTMDIYCHDGPFVVDEVFLSWSGVKQVCSVYISGGQNFALFQNTSLDSNDQQDNSTRLAVDGRKSFSDPCFTGLPTVGDQTWTLTFAVHKIVNEIIIHRKLRGDGYTFMNGFYVMGYNEEGKLLFRYNDTGTSKGSLTIWILTEVSAPMKKIVIAMDNASETRYLELCEVEAFGGCAAPAYGIYCNEICGEHCLGRECHVNGLCVTCAYGSSSKGECFLSPREIIPTPYISTTEWGDNATTPHLECTTVTSAPAEEVDNSMMIKLFILIIIILSLLDIMLLYLACCKKSENIEEEPPVTDVGVILDAVNPASIMTVPSHATQSAHSVSPYDKVKSEMTVKTTTSVSTHIE
ncbi:uncharacterized protein LOC106052547 [Biomphalaria glabrata]|uniref:Uncharacterized protein LOC106052547 n=1 Tax=Biomphalaria glabrata TaxID=6526 RepID=A0A9W2ZFF7_BIOGL|nr:uncharacterized protein LOC106052547 [Biomphalaria glabrata]